MQKDRTQANTRPQNSAQYEAVQKSEVITKVKWVMPQAQRQQMDFSYAKSLPGLVKIITTIVAFITFIVAISAKWGLAAILWTSLMSWMAFWVPGAFMAVYVVFPHCLADERTRNGVALLELVFYFKGTLMFFVCIWFMIGAAAGYTTGGNVLGVILCIVMTVIFAVETFLKLMTWKQITGGPQPTTQQMP